MHPTDPPRRRANKRKGRGTYANDRPPIISVVSRETGEHLLWGCEHADMRTCRRLIADHVPSGSTQLYTDEWPSDRSSHPCHATVHHAVREWARDDNDDGRREVHCNPCEGVGAMLRMYLRAFRGVHKPYLHLYMATYEAMLNAKRVTPHLIQRMCISYLEAHMGYTRAKFLSSLKYYNHLAV